MATREWGGWKVPEAGSVVLVLRGPYGGLLGVVKDPSCGHQAGVWFRQQGAPPAEFALVDVADLTVVGAMPGAEVASPPPVPAAGNRGGLRTTLAEGADQVFENGTAAGARAERERILAVVGKVRAEALSHASTAYGSGSEGPENAGKIRACDAIAKAILGGPK